MPSSLTTLLPFVLGFSPHLPVSVCGTGTFTLDSGFSRQCGIIRFGTVFSLSIKPSNRKADLPASLSIRSWPSLPAARSNYPPASPLLSYAFRRYGNFHPLSFAYAFRPRLRSRLTPGGRTFPGKPRTFDGADSHRALATHSSILSAVSSTCPLGHASPLRHAPLPSRPRLRKSDSRGFGMRFSPVNFRRRPTRLVSCYALFK